MSQAARDLPDPMEPPPALAASSPDDLLAQMADEAIDKLMAEADKGVTPVATAPPPPVEPHADNPDEAAVMSVAAAVPISPAIPNPATPVAAVEHATESPSVSSAVDSAPVDGIPSAAAVTPMPVEPPPPAADVQALLREAPVSPSPLLLPLRIINSPFSFLSDGARRALGLIGLVTLVPAICAIAYVLYFKHRW